MYIATGAVGLGVGAAAGYLVPRTPEEEPVPDPPVEFNTSYAYTGIYQTDQFLTRCRHIIDNDKCQLSGGPLLCESDCLRKCPMTPSVLYAEGAGGEEGSGLGEPPETKWTLDTMHQDLCVGCGNCVEMCPQGALKIEVINPQGEVIDVIEPPEV